MREHGTGAALFGYTKLYGQVPGGQAEYLRVPQAQFGPIKVPEGPPDDRFLYLSDVLPTAWQAVEYADVPDGGTVARARPRTDRRDGRAHRPAPRRRQVIGVDLVPERLRAWPRRTASRCSTSTTHDDVAGGRSASATGGRGPDAVIDAVGMEAHGSPGRAGRPAARRAAARRGRAADDGEGRHRPAGRAARRDRRRAPRRHDLDQSASTAGWPTRCR